MRDYELVFILRPDLDEAAISEQIDRVKTWIAEASGKVEKVDLWGKRKLAFPIRKQIEGHYVLMHFSMETAYGQTLERNLRFTEPVIRFLLIGQ